MRRSAVIAGVGLSRQANAFEEESSFDVIWEAINSALDDAGLTTSDIDGINAAWPGPGGATFMPGSPDWANVLSTRISWSNDSYPQGVPALLTAAAAIEAGLCNTVLVANGQAGTRRQSAGVMPWTQPQNEFTEPYGSTTPSQFALIAKRYEYEFGLSGEQLAGVSAAIRNYGDINPDAVMFGRGPVGTAQVLASPMVADPLHLLDVCLATEGAAAMILTTAERALDTPKPGIRILSGEMEWIKQQYVGPPLFKESYSIGQRFAERLFGRPGIGRSDVDVFELYDPTSFEVIRQFEILGYCGLGEGPDFVSESELGREGKIPTNTDGGLLSFSHPGMAGPTLKIVEAVRQLRGEGGNRQVAGAEIALVTGAGSAANYFQAALLAA